MHEACAALLHHGWLSLDCLDVKRHISHTALLPLVLSLLLLLFLSILSEPGDTQNTTLTTMSLSNSSTPLDQTSTTHSREQDRILGTVVFTWLLMLTTVSLRFVARRLSKAALWYDDWLMIPAAVRQVFGPLSHHAY